MFSVLAMSWLEMPSRRALSWSMSIRTALESSFQSKLTLLQRADAAHRGGHLSAAARNCCDVLAGNRYCTG